MTDEALQAEARDPSTPPERLLELIQTHLADVVENPGLSLVALEMPDFWNRADESSAVAFLASSRACPASLAWWLLEHEPREHWLQCLLSNDAVPPPLRRQALLRMPLGTTVITPMPYGDFLTPAELRLLTQSVVHGRPQTEDFSEAEVDTLARLGGWGRYRAMCQPRASAALLRRLYDEVKHLPSLGHYALIFQQRHTPLDLLEEALRSPDLSTRQHAVLSPQLTAAQFDAAAADTDVRSTLARNPALPEAWVDAFLRHESLWVRQGLAENPALSPERQLVLAEDEEMMVRDALLQNPSLTVAARRRCLRTLKRELARRAAEREAEAAAATQAALAKQAKQSKGRKR